jgi:hypothetical protein
MNVSITSNLQLFYYTGSSSVSFVNVIGIENVEKIYSFSGDRWNFWQNGFQNNTLDSFSPEQGYLIVSKDQFSSYTLQIESEELTIYSTFAKEEISILKYVGDNFNLDNETHNFSQVFKIVSGAYQSWNKLSASNVFSELEDGETYLVVAQNTNDLPSLFSINIPGFNYYAVSSSDNVSIINSSSGLVDRKINIMPDSEISIIDSKKRHMYVASPISQTISIIDLDTEKLLSTILLNRDSFSPNLMKLDNNLLYVSSTTSNHMYIINTDNSQIIEEVHFKTINGNFYDFESINGDIYLTNSVGNLLKIEDKPWLVQQLDYPITSKSHDSYFANSFSVSSNAEILAVQKRSNRVSFYKRVDKRYVHLSYDIVTDYDIESVQISGDGKTLLLTSHKLIFNEQENLYSRGIISTWRLNGNKWEEKVPAMYGDNDNDGTHIAGYYCDINYDGTVMAVSYQGTSLLKNKIAAYKLDTVNNTWSMIGSFIYADSQVDNFGYSVSINRAGTVVAASSYFQSGYIKILDIDIINNTLTERNHIAGSDLENLGFNIDLDGSGTRLLATCLLTGEVKVFDYSGSTLGWLKIGSDIYFENSLQNASPVYGQLSSSGKTMILGNPIRNNRLGAARVYRFKNQDWHQIGFTFRGDYPNHNFGDSVSVDESGQIFNVTAPGKTNGLNKTNITTLEFNKTEF